jgi:uncharacterized protein
MRFNVAQLLKEGTGARRNYSLDETFKPLPEIGTTRVRGELTLTGIDKGIWASGSVETNASITCARCLAIAENSVRFRLNEEYLAAVEVDGDASVSTQESPDVLDVREGAFTLDSHHVLDLTEAIRQYVIVNLPMKPLCHQNCAGLCSTCGADLNNHPCDCSTYTDSKWSPLLDLLTANGKG